VTLPPATVSSSAGSSRAASRRQRLLFWLSLGVVVAMFFMLATAFRSAPLAGLIMVNLPLALIGGIAGVFASGGVLSVASIIGLIALLGIAARNGIMLVSHIEHLRNEEGVTDLREAVTQGVRRSPRADPDDRPVDGVGARAGGARCGRAGERDSGADGQRHHSRAGLVDHPEHAGGARVVLRVAPP
jgi:hypothetical protein